MIDSKCEHKETGARGIIKSKLDATDKFPDQWGIFWTSGANQNQFGNHPYWNDKDKIKILSE